MFHGLDLGYKKGVVFDDLFLWMAARHPCGAFFSHWASDVNNVYTKDWAQPVPWPRAPFSLVMPRATAEQRFDVPCNIFYEVFHLMYPPKCKLSWISSRIVPLHLSPGLCQFWLHEKSVIKDVRFCWKTFVEIRAHIYLQTRWHTSPNGNKNIAGVWLCCG